MPPAGSGPRRCSRDAGGGSPSQPIPAGGERLSRRSQQPTARSAVCCSKSPGRRRQYSGTPGSKRRPGWNGAPSDGHVSPGYQACTLTAVTGESWPAPYLSVAHPCTVLLACPGTPPAAGRAWVPGCRVRTFVRSSFLLRFSAVGNPAAVIDSLSESISPIPCAGTSGSGTGLRYSVSTGIDLR